MNEPVNIPQLNAPQLAVTSRPEDARSANEMPAADGAATQSFSEVLKSKSAAKPEEKSRDEAADAPTGDAVVSTAVPALPVGDVNPLAPQLLAQLACALPVAFAARGEAAAPRSTAPEADERGTTALTETSVKPADALPIPADAPNGVFAVASSQIPIAAPIPATVPPAYGTPTETDSRPAPALTLRSGESPRSGAKATIGPDTGATTQPEISAGQGSRPSNLAASSAISAESAKASSESRPSDPAIEFRASPERLASHSDAGLNPATLVEVAQQTRAGAADAIPIRVATPFSHPGWPQEVEQKLTWMVGNGRQEADLVLNPPQLGRIEVTLVVEGDQVNASFATPHQAVRDAIEESLVRLRESLADSGISLGQTHVGRESSRDAPFFMGSRNDGPRGSSDQRDPAFRDSGLHTQTASWVPSRGRGMVDVFA